MQNIKTNEKYKNRILTVMHLARIMKDSADQGERFCFVLGAGASRESGIKTGIEMAREWGSYIEEHSDEFGRDNVEQLKKHLKLKDLAKADSKHYFDIYDFRWRGERRNGYHYIEKTIENVLPSYGYYPLAMLLSETRNNLILTTNFDNLAEDALTASTNIRPLVVGHESLTDYIDFNQSRPIIAKIHRDLFLNPLSSQEDTNQLKDGWKNALTKAFGIYMPVVIGYAGGDNSLMGYFNDKATKLRGLYWCYRKGETPSKEIQRLVLNKNGYFVEISGFDSVMCLVGNKFGYKSPSAKISDCMAKRAETLTKNYEERYKQLMNEFEAASSSDEEASTVKNVLKSESEKRKEELDAKIAQNPNDALAYNNRGDFNYSHGIFKDAADDFTIAISLNPGNPLFFCNRGCAYNKLEKYELAINDFTRNIELLPNDSRAYNNRGYIYAQLEKYELAINDFNKAIKEDPDYAIAYDNRGYVHAKLKEYELAINDYDKAIELDTSYANPYRHRGNIYSALGKYNDALTDISKAIEINSDYEEAYRDRAKVYTTLNQPDKAAEDIAKADKLSSKDN